MADWMPGEQRAWHRRETWLAAAVLLAAACILHFEVLFLGHVYHMDDAADGYYPGHIAVLRAFAHGQLPTWERGSWAGWPLVVDPYNGVFYPLNLLFHAIGAARGLGYSIALHVFLGGLGVFVLLRRHRRLGFEAALFGALAYELSTFGVVRIRHVIFVQMLAWLPWILVGVERFLAERRGRDLALVAAATGLSLLTGALSIAHFAMLVVAAWTVARVAAEAGSGDGRFGRLRRFAVDAAALGGAALAGALIAAAQVVPTIAHLPHSPRSLASDYKFTSSYGWPDLSYLVTLLAPDFFGGEDRGQYVGAPNHWELAGWSVGALCVLLAPLALLPPASKMMRRSNELLQRSKGGRVELWVLALLVLLAVGIALGDAAPVHRWLYHHVPLYAALRCTARALLMAVLALPILGAHGLEALLDRVAPPDGARPDRGAWLRALAIGLGLGLALAGALYGLKSFGARAISPRSAGWTYLAALIHLGAILGAGALAVASATLLPRRVSGALFALVLAVDLLWTGRLSVALYNKPADYPSGMERFAAVEWILKNDPPRPPDHDGGGDRFVNDPRGPFRLHNVGMVLGLENASGYDSVPIWRYVDFLHILKHGRRYPHRELRDDFAAIGVDVHSPYAPRLLDLLNVRWLLAGDPPGGDHARWVERFAPPTNAPSGAPAARYEPWWDPRMKVFENTRALPRAFVAHRAEVPGSDDALAARLIARDFDPGATVLLEEPPGLPLGDEAVPPTPARTVETGRHRLLYETDDPRPGVLVISDAHYPGWTVTVDGAPARLLRADYAFRGVPLPPGRHRVELRFRSRPTELGLAASGAGIGLALALALVPWAVRRGRKRPAVL